MRVSTRHLEVIIPTGGPFTVGVAQALETDSASQLAKVVAVGQVAETDTAQTLRLALIHVLGQPAETDLAQAFTVVGPQAPSNTDPPTLVGDFRVGRQVRALTGTWA